MKLVKPVAISDNDILEVQVNDVDLVETTAEWDIGTTYEPDDRVIAEEDATIYVYQCVNPSGSTGDYPQSDDGTNWVIYGVKSRFRPFDNQLSPQLVGNSKIRYKLDFISSLKPAGYYNVIFLNVDADTVKCATRLISNNAVQTDRSIDISGSVDNRFAVFENVYIDETMYLQVTAEAAGSVVIRLGEIVIGIPVDLGDIETGSQTSIVDFSTKNVDEFGNVSIVERAYVDTSTFKFSFRTDQTRRISYELAQARATPACYHGGEGEEDKGLLVFGFWQDFRLTVNTNSSLGTLEVQGLV
ncbi:hypothetical protein A8B82_04475 [Sulfitobacter sp. EhC04]|uniref:hypothetical protein n=1 Tax=Sulfitobacter sp. EhC04 TaxID=1849168 RepID=UPI0007F362E5|nr:hypothetical protein [Sulfitobacter sp. EhC04]OAN71542.1 hypothetical protein A8B82_04475 [Sulfitobacter sp. EhC04]